MTRGFRDLAGGEQPAALLRITRRLSLLWAAASRLTSGLNKYATGPLKGGVGAAVVAPPTFTEVSRLSDDNFARLTEFVRKIESGFSSRIEASLEAVTEEVRGLSNVCTGITSAINRLTAAVSSARGGGGGRGSAAGSVVLGDPDDLPSAFASPALGSVPPGPDLPSPSRFLAPFSQPDPPADERASGESGSVGAAGGTTAGPVTPARPVVPAGPVAAPGGATAEVGTVSGGGGGSGAGVVLGGSFPVLGDWADA